MSQNSLGAGHSAKVNMELRVAGDTLRVMQAAPDYVFVDHPRDIPPCAGEISITIDGREHLQRVILPLGMSADSQRVAISDCIA